jgi:hypothetical protein
VRAWQLPVFTEFYRTQTVLDGLIDRSKHLQGERTRMPNKRKKRQVVRSLIAHAVIENSQYYGGVLVFYLDIGTELHVEMPCAAFQKLRDHMTAALDRVSTSNRAGAPLR